MMNETKGTKMNKNEMSKKIVERFKKEGIEVSVIQKVENNCGRIPCFSIPVRSPETDGPVAGIAVPVDKIIEKYEKGMSIEDIYCELVKTEEENRENILRSIPITTGIGSWDNVKDRIFVRLVNLSMNKKILDEDEILYEEITDLAAVYYLEIARSKEGFQSTKISKRMMKTWGVSFETIKEAAMKKVEKEACCCSMEDLVTKFLFHSNDDKKAANRLYDPDFKMSDMESPVPMLALTNMDYVNGAASILSDGILKRVQEIVGDEKFILIPSSVHEWIIVPYFESSSIISEIIGQANADRNIIQKRDILSDHPYIYDGEKICLMED